jgi:hypothetical protein
MPYLKFHTTDKTTVQLSGNSTEDIKKAIEKNGKIAHVPDALAWVTAFFDHRALLVTRQKAARGEVQVDEDELEQKIEATADKEADLSETYTAVCKGKMKSKAESTTSDDSNKKDNDGYDDFYNAPTTINEVSEDMF